MCPLFELSEFGNYVCVCVGVDAWNKTTANLTEKKKYLWFLYEWPEIVWNISVFQANFNFLLFILCCWHILMCLSSCLCGEKVSFNYSWSNYIFYFPFSVLFYKVLEFKSENSCVKKKKRKRRRTEWEGKESGGSYNIHSPSLVWKVV